MQDHTRKRIQLLELDVEDSHLTTIFAAENSEDYLI